MIKGIDVEMASSVVICIDGEEFTGTVTDRYSDLICVELDHNGKDVYVTEVIKIIASPISDDDKQNPAPERGDAPCGPVKKTKAAPQKQKGKKKAAPEKSLSLINAAHKVLLEEGRAMSCPEMVKAVIAKGYWQKGTGKTPEMTLYAAILRELKTSNERFKRSEVGGKFCAGS